MNGTPVLEDDIVLENEELTDDDGKPLDVNVLLELEGTMLEDCDELEETIVL